MLELEKTLKDYDRFLKLSKRGCNKGWSSFQNAEEQYEKAAKLTEEILQNILEERGLAFCSVPHHVEENENMENITVKRLGIYHREQMRLHYYVCGPYTIQGEYEDSVGMDRTLRLLCPKHFPKKTEWTYRQDGLYTYINSEVFKKDGKFVLAVNGADITELVNKGGLCIDPDGLRPILIEQAVFRYFG